MRIDDLARRLAGLPATTIEAPKRAAVAIVLRECGPHGAEALLIERAHREEDPWSGHMAFPGGRHDPADADLEATARREAREEVGLDLGAQARPLGRLSDQQAGARGRKLPLAVSPYVFALAEPSARLSPDPREVAEALWVPLRPLIDGAHNSTHVYWAAGLVPIPLPCFRYRDKDIWGLTYKTLRSLLDLTTSSP